MANYINYMGKRPDKNLIIGLDVGTSKIAAHANDIGYIDMRYTNGFAIGWRQGGARVASGMPEEDNPDGTY